MSPGKQYLFKFASKVVPGIVTAVDYRIDVNTFEHSKVDDMQLNDIAVVNVQLEQKVVVDAYNNNRATGAFIIIDRLTNITVGAGMVSHGLDTSTDSGQLGGGKVPAEFSEFEKDLNALVRKHFPHWDAKDISKL